MNRKERLIVEQLVNGEKYYYRNISVDNVIFGYNERDLKVLLLKPAVANKWFLPGGYVLKKESMESAAARIVRYRTDLKDIKLFQFKTFSDPERNKNSYFTTEILQTLTKQPITKDHWLLDEFISVGFFALTEYSKVQPMGDFYAEKCQWWDLNNLPELSYDHKNILKEAMKALKIFVHHFPIGYELLPEKFTIPDIQSLYETILERKFDNRNFTKKMISLGLIVKLDEKKNIGKHRSPFLYKFDIDKYNELIKTGEVIVI